MKVYRRPLFLLDLAEELTWLRDKADPDIAARWFEALQETIRFLQKNPLIGRERKDLRPPGLRSWRIRGFPRWLLFYSVGADASLVFYRIRSGTMNLVVLKLKS